MANTESCANCSSCPYGFYHARNLTGLMHPDFEGKPWSQGYSEPSCDGRGILKSDGKTDCLRCDTCPDGKYASGVGRCTGNGIWKDPFTCTDCKPCPSGYEHAAPCNGSSFDDTCKVCTPCQPGSYISSYWNATSKRMVCTCTRCMDRPGDMCQAHNFRTNVTCSGAKTYDESCQGCSLCNTGEYIADNASCVGTEYRDTSAGMCRWALELFLSSSVFFRLYLMWHVQVSSPIIWGC